MNYEKEISDLKRRVELIEELDETNSRTLRTQGGTLRILSFYCLGNAIVIILLGINLIRLVCRLL